ncbi:hypothetical protein BpHYR1_034240 [Brachionus plicatilis]|uniref:Uncharacterized protein n=1 Tax=Brachionus plicatilis TaxID=10195 RepID=A0A3M7RWU4_BRAPC|nr:hypothetical protein BpHYR1_034240 [Brachionus plicatilis]
MSQYLRTIKERFYRSHPYSILEIKFFFLHKNREFSFKVCFSLNHSKVLEYTNAAITKRIFYMI